MYTRYTYSYPFNSPYKVNHYPYFYHHGTNCACFEVYIKFILFCVWYPLLNILPIKFIHTIAIEVVCSFSFLNSILLYEYIIIYLFNYWWVFGLFLGLLWLLWLVLVRTFFPMYFNAYEYTFVLGMYLRVKLLGRRYTWHCQRVLKNSCANLSFYQFYIICTCCGLNLLSLMTKDVKYLFRCLLAIWISSFESCCCSLKLISYFFPLLINRNSL